MRIGVIGAGRIGGNAGTQLARSGHEVMFSGSRRPERLEQMAADLSGATAGSPAEAVSFAEVLIFSVPWSQIDDVLAQAGSLSDRVVIDTTNQYGASGLEDLGDVSAAETNAMRMPGARLAKAFNTYTSGFQREVAEGLVDGEIAMFFSSDDERAADATSRIVADCGFVPVRLDWRQVRLMEAPRRDGAVYGEAYQPEDAARLASAATSEPGRAAELASELKL
jgi:predicted dinucleotide-binding enzyme